MHGLVAGVATAFVPFAAFAQSANSGPRMGIVFDMQVRHDSNATRSDAARAATRGLSRSDERVTPAVQLDIYQPFGRNSFSVAGSVGYDLHRRNSSLDRERIQLDSGLKLAAAICSLDLHATASRRQSDLGDFAFVPVAGQDTTKNVETVISYGAQLGCGAEIGLRPFAGISRDEGDNSNVFRSRSDYRTTSYQTGVEYRHPTIGTAKLYVSRRNPRYPNRFIGGRQDGYRQTSYGGSFERNIGARMKASVDVAYTKLDSRGTFARSFGGLTWNGTLSAAVSPSVKLSAIVGRKVDSSLNNEAAYHVGKTYGIDGSFAVNPRVTFQTGYSLEPRRYIYSVAVLPPALEREKRNRTYGRIIYKRSQRLSVNFDLGYEKRRANGTIFDYGNTYASGGFQISF